MNNFLLFDHPFIVSVFVYQGRTKALTSHLSLHCLCSFTSYLFILRLRHVYWSTLKIANGLPIFASYYAFVIVSLTWLAYFVSRDYLSYKFTRFFIYFLFLPNEGPILETLDHTIRIGSTPTFLYFDIWHVVTKCIDHCTAVISNIIDNH